MELLAGRYRLAERLGEGGGGTVWRAVDELLRREVAIKQVRIPPELGEAELAEFTARAIQEARAAGRLSHPSIVMIHDVIGHGGRPWIVMDLVPGRSLDKVIREEGPLPVPRAAEIGLSVLDALEAAHARGILHRDVKPANVLIASDGRALLTDFGIAAPIGRESAARHGTAGSPGYMAPERFRGEPDGPPSDLWSLGATLYTAVEGCPPFQRDIAAAIVAAVLLHEPRPMTRATPEIAWLVRGLLDKDPSRRPTPQVVREVLRAAAAGGSTAAPAHRAPHSVSPGGLGRTLRLVLLGVAVAAAGVAAGLGAWHLTAGEQGGDPGRFASAPDPCRALSNAEVRELLGVDADKEPGPSACRWRDHAGGRTMTVAYRIARPDQGGVAAAARELAARRSGGEGGCGASARGQSGIADEAFACDVSEANAVGTTVWFRRSNLLVEVAYRRASGAAIGPDDRRTAVHAAELVAVGLG